MSDNITGSNEPGSKWGTGGVAERPTYRSVTNGEPPSQRASTEDWEILRRVRDGQSEAFGALILRYQDRVFNTCWRICGNLEDARDLTQESFLKAYERLDSFKQESGFYTWLFRIAVNLAISFRRSSARRRQVPLDIGSEGTQADVLAQKSAQAAEQRSADLTADVGLQRLVVRALQELDEDYRAVVVLRDIEGFDYREIAEILDIPHGTVRSRLHRAREALRKAVEPALRLAE